MNGLTELAFGIILSLCVGEDTSCRFYPQPESIWVERMVSESVEACIEVKPDGTTRVLPHNDVKVTTLVIYFNLSHYQHKCPVDELE